MFSVENISVFERLIGRQVSSLISSRVLLFQDEITCLDRVLGLRLADVEQAVFFSSHFFESDDGQVFHDYEIQPDNKYEQMMFEYLFEDFFIKGVEVYGRNFSADDFVSYPAVYSKITQNRRIENIFVFYSDVDVFMVSFHDFFPNIHVYLGGIDRRSILQTSPNQYYLCHSLGSVGAHSFFGRRLSD